MCSVAATSTFTFSSDTVCLTIRALCCSHKHIHIIRWHCMSHDTCALLQPQAHSHSPVTLYVSRYVRSVAATSTFTFSGDTVCLTIHSHCMSQILYFSSSTGLKSMCVILVQGGGGSSSGSQHSPGGYLPHVGHQNQPQTPTPSSTPVSDMSPQPPHGMSGSPPVVSWDMKPTAPAHHPAAHHPHHHTHPGYMPQYSWYQADANQGLLTWVSHTKLCA